MTDTSLVEYIEMLNKSLKEHGNISVKDRDRPGGNVKVKIEYTLISKDNRPNPHCFWSESVDKLEEKGEKVIAV